MAVSAVDVQLAVVGWWRLERRFDALGMGTLYAGRIPADVRLPTAQIETLGPGEIQWSSGPGIQPFSLAVACRLPVSADDDSDQRLGDALSDWLSTRRVKRYAKPRGSVALIGFDIKPLLVTADERTSDGRDVQVFRGQWDIWLQIPPPKG